MSMIVDEVASLPDEVLRRSEMTDSGRPRPERHRLWVVNRLSETQVAERAAQVLRRNDRGRLTVAAPRLYPHMWSWDAAFIAVGLARMSPSRALTELETLFAAQWRNGMVPHIVFAANAPLYEPGPDRWASQETSPHAPDHAATSGLIQPPVHALALLRILDAVRDRGATERRDIVARVRALWPRLLAWHRYLAEHRDADGRGLLTIYHGWESGMDNSPRWDVPYADVVPDPGFRPFRRSDLAALGERAQRPTDADYVKYQWLIEELRQARYDDELARKSLSFRVADVFASAIFTAANEDLARVGDELGLSAGDELLGYAERFRRGVVGTTDEDGFAADVDLRSDTTLRTKTLAGFAPLLSGGLDAERRRRLVDLLHSPAWCGNPGLAYALPPSASPEAPEFDVARYWRGPQWPPMNLLIIWGLERSGAYDAADRLRESALYQLTDGVFAEYYQPFTAHPLGSRPQSWTAAVALELALR
jgi:glucosylglycerate hydrolase